MARIYDDGTAVPGHRLGELTAGVPLGEINATYRFLLRVFGDDDKPTTAAPAWTIRTPDGLACLSYRGGRLTPPGATSGRAWYPRARPDRAVTWGITGFTFPAAAWVVKAVNRAQTPAPAGCGHD